MHIQIRDHSSHTPFPTAKPGRALDNQENLWLWRTTCKQQGRDLAVLQTKRCNLQISETLWPAAVSEQETRDLEIRGTCDPTGPMWAVGEEERDEHNEKLMWSGDDESVKKDAALGHWTEMEKWRTRSKQEPCETISSKVHWTQCMLWLNKVDLLCFGRVSRLTVALQFCWLYAQCGHSSSHQCCHGVKSQTPLAVLQITWQSQTPNCPYCPCRCLDVVNKKEAEAILSRSSHWRFYPITVTHTLKESKHVRPKGTTRIQTVSVSSATAQSCYISVFSLTDYSSHKFRHESCFFPLLPWLSSTARLSLCMNVAISMGEYQPSLKSNGKLLGCVQPICWALNLQNCLSDFSIFTLSSHPSKQMTYYKILLLKNPKEMKSRNSLQQKPTNAKDVEISFLSMPFSLSIIYR